MANVFRLEAVLHGSCQTNLQRSGFDAHAFVELDERLSPKADVKRVCRGKEIESSL